MLLFWLLEQQVVGFPGFAHKNININNCVANACSYVTSQLLHKSHYQVQNIRSGLWQIIQRVGCRKIEIF